MNEKFTAEEVRAMLTYGVDKFDQYAVAKMLAAYAALLEQREAGVTDEVVERACRAYYNNASKPVYPPVFEGIKAALQSVWPVAAKPTTNPTEIASKLVGDDSGQVWDWQEKVNNLANNIGESLNAGCDQDAVDRINVYVDELFALAAQGPGRALPVWHQTIDGWVKGRAPCPEFQEWVKYEDATHPADNGRAGYEASLRKILSVAQGDLHMLKLAIEAHDPSPEILFRIADTERDLRTALDVQGHGEAIPTIHIRCETRSAAVVGSTTLRTIRVECEDDGAFTAVTDHWPASPAGVPDGWEIDVGEKSAAIRHRSGAKLVIRLDKDNALLFDLLHQLAAAQSAPEGDGGAE